MTRVASLAMYDPAELHAANDALWDAIVARLRTRGVSDLPERLARGDDLEAVWRDPDLILAQTCGYPLATTLAECVRVVATPRYAAPGCFGTEYRSAVVVRVGVPWGDLADLRGARAAVNDLNSNSGMNLLRAALAPIARKGAFLSEVRITGAHARSAAEVASGLADVAAIDCVTWALLQRHSPEICSTLRVLTWTAPNPGLPLITSRTTSVRELDALRRSLAEVAEDSALRPVLDELLIDGFSVTPSEQYRAPLELEAYAAELGYPKLA